MSHLWAQGNGESSSQAYQIGEKSEWMCVEKEKDWDPRFWDLRKECISVAQSRSLVFRHPKFSSYLSLAV